MKKEKYTIEGSGKSLLSVTLWIPDGPQKYILQITHGMTEHIGRYEDFADELSNCGIISAGFDLPGHGENSTDANCASMGRDGWKTALKNMELLNKHLKMKFPDMPICMLGFSLGSFLLRDFLSQNSDKTDTAIIIGTGYQPAVLLKILKMIVKGQIKKAGFDKTTSLVNQMSFGMYNRKFKPNSTKADWLCADEMERKKYCDDPLCRQTISSGLFWQLLDGMERTGNKKTYKEWNKKLPVLLLSGSCDPVGNQGAGVKSVETQMKKAGIYNVKSVLIPNGRHDIFHEVQNGGREQVIKNIEEFLNIGL